MDNGKPTNWNYEELMFALYVTATLEYQSNYLHLSLDYNRNKLLPVILPDPGKWELQV